MPKLKVLSGFEVCGILRANGFEEARQESSHVTMQKRTAGTTISVPVPMHKEVAVGTLGNIIRRSRLPRSLFEVA